MFTILRFFFKRLGGGTVVPTSFGATCRQLQVSNSGATQLQVSNSGATQVQV